MSPQTHKIPCIPFFWIHWLLPRSLEWYTPHIRHLSLMLTRFQLAHVLSHYHPPASVLAYISVLYIPPVIVTFLAPSSSSALGFVRSLAIYLVSLGSSITVYRLSPFHPLAKYPGPLLARVSRLWATRHAASGRQNYVSHELFERYGDVVRTGPNHLIIRNASAIPVVLGAKNPWPKHARESRVPC
jgi:hypothetical protein